MNFLNARMCRSRRKPFARYTRKSIVTARKEARSGRESGPRGYRILLAGRSASATKSEVGNMKRAKWRNFDWCLGLRAPYTN